MPLVCTPYVVPVIDGCTFTDDVTVPSSVPSVNVPGEYILIPAPSVAVIVPPVIVVVPLFDIPFSVPVIFPPLMFIILE